MKTVTFVASIVLPKNVSKLFSVWFRCIPIVQSATKRYFDTSLRFDSKSKSDIAAVAQIGPKLNVSSSEENRCCSNNLAFDQ